MNLPARLELLTVKLLRCNSSRAVTNAAQMALTQKAAIIRKVTGLRITLAKGIINDFSKGLSSHPFQHFKRIDEIIGDWKLNPCTIEESSDLFSLSYFTLRQKKEFLHECGTDKIKASTIFNLEHFTTKPLEIFKALIQVDAGVNLKELWISSLADASLQEDARRRVEALASHKTPASLLRNTIFACYLAKKWGGSVEEALEVVESGVKNKPCSLQRLQDALDTLLEMGFDKASITAHPEVLCAESRSLKLFQGAYKELLGMDARQFLFENPVVASRMDFEVLHDNLQNLLRYEIPVETIRHNAAKLLTCDPYSLAEKLKYFATFPELVVFAHNPNFVKLLDNMDTVAIRLETLRAINPRLISFKLCMCPPDEFVKVVQSSRIPAHLSTDVLKYLEAYTGKSSDALRQALTIHPHHQHLSVVNMKDVMQFLVKEKFTPDQIFEGIHLILYPVELLRKKLAVLSSRPDMQPFSQKRQDLRLLHYLIYLIEAEYDFTGSGVFAKNTREKPEPSPQQ